MRRLVRLESLGERVNSIVVEKRSPFLFHLIRVPFLMGKKSEDHKCNTSCHVQVLGVGTDTGCTVPSVLLFFDRKRYLFNVGEGFQRFCVEHRVKLTKVTSVLSTRSTTHTLGGLPGMLLTMKDVTAGGLLAGHVGYDIHGPPGLKTAANAFKTFVSFKDLGLKIREIGSSKDDCDRGLAEICAPVITNDSVTITPVLTWATIGDGEPAAKKQRIDEDESRVCNTNHEGPVASYVCQLPDIPGKFLPQKAAALGVPRGPLYGKLQKGESVQASNGTMVQPEDVMEPSTPGPTAIIVDCPTEDYIDGVVDSVHGLCAWSTSEKRDRVAVVVHLAPRDILRTPKYLEFIGSFPSSTKHVLVSESSSDGTPIMKKSAMLHAKLQYLDPVLFQPLHHCMEESLSNPFPSNCRPGRNMIKYCLRPVAKTGFNEEECSDPMSPEESIKELQESKPGISEIVESIKSFNNPNPCPSIPRIVTSSDGDDVRVTFLGTGASVPSKYRNVTGILLQNKDASMLMDCGESSLGQLYKRFGKSETEDILRSLSCIWISHIHADHHMGLASIIGARSRVLGDSCTPLLIIGPRPLRKMLHLYSALEPMRFVYIEASHTENSEQSQEDSKKDLDTGALEALEAAKTSLGIRLLESVRVQHCSHAFALVMESNDFDHEASTGWKIVFSGDSRPCKQLTKAATHATLLIHEATFEDTMLEEAIEKNHSTTGEAISTGRDAEAYMTMLTHFSQRYPKIPVIDDSFSGRVGVAFDLMTVRLSDIPRLPLLTPAVKMLFEEPNQPEDAQDG